MAQRCKMKLFHVWKEARWVLAAQSVVRRSQTRSDDPACLAQTRPASPQQLQSGGGDTWRWEWADMWLHECKRYRRDGIYRWSTNTEWTDNSLSHDAWQKRMLQTWWRQDEIFFFFFWERKNWEFWIGQGCALTWTQEISSCMFQSRRSGKKWPVKNSRTSLHWLVSPGGLNLSSNIKADIHILKCYNLTDAGDCSILVLL